MSYNAVIFTDMTDNLWASKALGAYKCAHELRLHGYSCLVVDNFHTYSFEELSNLLSLTIGSDTYFVGISTTFLLDSNTPKNPDGSQRPYAVLPGEVFCPQGQEFEDNFVLLLRKLNPNIKVVIGGIAANPNFQSNNADYHVLGYAEVSIVNLAKHLHTGDILQHSTVNKFGKIVIDDRFAKTYDIRTSTMEWLYPDVINQTVLPLEIARGCIFKCGFCSYPMNGKKTLDFVRNAEIIASELQENYNKYNIKTYMVVDDTFNDNDVKLDAIHAAFKQLSFQPELLTYIRLDLVARNPIDNMKKLYEIGVRAAHFGIETLNSVSAKIIGKGFDSKKIIDTVQYIRSTYKDMVSLHGSFIVGLPEESIDSVVKTQKLLMSGELPLHTWMWYPLHIQKNDRFAWNSKIGLNVTDYGYTELPSDLSSSSINWVNQFTSFTEATYVADKFNNESRNSDKYYIPNRFVWGIMPMGYTINELTTTKYSTLNFNKIENDKVLFANEYKLKLFEYLRSKR